MIDIGRKNKPSFAAAHLERGLLLRTMISYLDDGFCLASGIEALAEMMENDAISRAGEAVNSGMEKQSIKRGPKRMTEKQLAANRRNASMAGRPAGSMNADKFAFRDRFRAKEVELAENLINLALHGKTEQIRVAATDMFHKGLGCLQWGHKGLGCLPSGHNGDQQRRAQSRANPR